MKKTCMKKFAVLFQQLILRYKIDGIVQVKLKVIFIFFFYLISLLFTSIFFINFKKYDDDSGNMKDTQDIFEEQEIGNNKDFDKYKRENYNENSNENDHVSCYLAADLNANTGLSKIKKISENIDNSFNRHSFKSSAVGMYITYAYV